MPKKSAKVSPPKLERVAQLAMHLGGQHLAAYGSARSRQDFTQRQLMSCLILRAYLKTTYRGLLEILAGHERLRVILGMEEKLPHFTTLQKFSARSRVLEIADALIARIGQAALRRQAKSEEQVPWPSMRRGWKRPWPAPTLSAGPDERAGAGSSSRCRWSAGACFLWAW